MKFQKLRYDNINFFGDKIMIIASHPDDEILGCGGLLSKLKANKKTSVKVVFIAEGSSCRFSSKDDVNVVNKEIQLRNKYASQALSYLGVTNNKFYKVGNGSTKFLEYDAIDLKYKGQVFATTGSIDGEMYIKSPTGSMFIGKYTGGIPSSGSSTNIPRFATG